MKIKGCTRAAAAMLMLAGSAGCQNKTETGIAVGAGTGAILGGIIGNQSHGHGAGGAVIGGVVGAVAGGVVGHEMDKSDEQNRSYQSQDPPAQPHAKIVSKTDVINWTVRGTSDDVIIDRIQRNHAVFYLTGADVTQLRDSGVSENVILAMQDTAR